MNRLHFFILGLFMVAMGTGVVMGMALAKLPEKKSGSWLANELQLTPEQQDTMKSIWLAMARENGQKYAEKRREITKERDDEIFALIEDNKKLSYESCVDRYSQQLADLNRERAAAFNEAVTKTLAILDPTQKSKYEAMVNQGFRGSPWDRPPNAERSSGTRNTPPNPESQPVKRGNDAAPAAKTNLEGPH